MNEYSVLLPLYKCDNPEWFRYSLNSMLNQSVKAKEFVIICDGALTVELEDALLHFTEKYGSIFRIYRMEKNVGLGLALAKGVEMCQCEYIARMDADDYSVPTRCEKQLDRKSVV